MRRLVFAITVAVPLTWFFSAIGGNASIPAYVRIFVSPGGWIAGHVACAPFDWKDCFGKFVLVLLLENLIYYFLLSYLVLWAAGISGNLISPETHAKEHNRPIRRILGLR